MEKVRIDKYLWAIRVFKTRSLAADACSAGKITCNNSAVKPSYQVKCGDKYFIKIHKEYSKIIEVVDIVDKRGSAEHMKAFYVDHSPPYQALKSEPSAFYFPAPSRSKGPDCDWAPAPVANIQTSIVRASIAGLRDFMQRNPGVRALQCLQWALHRVAVLLLHCLPATGAHHCE